MTKPILAGIDAGGTSFKLGIAGPDGSILDRARVPTTTPAATIEASVAALRKLAEEAGGKIEALGIASFGPVDVDPASQSYGTILATPKEGWSGTPLLTQLSQALSVPAALDTDVNAALIAELAEEGLSRAAYITVGTGIGVGMIAAGQLAGRPSHPELGHVRVARFPGDETFEGVCPFHGDCLEGLASAPALIKRFGPLEKLPQHHQAWRLAGHYLGQLCLTLASTARLQRITIGGGVSEAPALVPEVARAFEALNNGYLPEATANLIKKAALGEDAGLKGALLLAARA
ncbi:ROK family protein [Parvularcula sp. ZS-1/3]|uniref:fructokinase n=1 Tax=Parvularcula mediterranea TaxID=2732508 RepID=A0A7Y3W5I5_9PROT|nr:ROK family protein [Parvularcula mediterranea]NNU16659.1 ROK family protein [Parvularcula mediterranea]